MFPRSYVVAKIAFSTLSKHSTDLALANSSSIGSECKFHLTYLNNLRYLTTSQRHLSDSQVIKSAPVDGTKSAGKTVSSDAKGQESVTILKSVTHDGTSAVELAKQIAKKVVKEPATEVDIKQLEEVKKKVAEMVKDAKPPPKVKKKALRVDLNVHTQERNFITPIRAMSDFLLKQSDLDGLRKTKRRSPYENEPAITVYWRKDVETRAYEVWGSKENLMKELLKQELERKVSQQNSFLTKRRLRDYRRERTTQKEIALAQNSGLWGPSGKVVLTAIAINGSNFAFKLIAWLYTGSHSMFSECIHSLADTINQMILAFGIHKSVQHPTSTHPYGYTNMKYVSSLISGVGIFCVGAGLSVYHGVMGLVDPHPIDSLFWAFCILGGSLVSEGATLLVAVNNIKKGALEKGISFFEYIKRGQDPSVIVILLEDFAAVISVTVAASCMALTTIYNTHIPDAVGSVIIGGILGGVASFIIYSNVAALVGRSIPQENLERINAELESDVMIRAIYDVKGIDMGNNLVRYKAELDFDGRELARSYLDTQDMDKLLEEVKSFQNIDQLESFILKHSENIVDMMGAEIDRIELKLRHKFPEIRHCDLEIL